MSGILLSFPVFRLRVFDELLQELFEFSSYDREL